MSALDLLSLVGRLDPGGGDDPSQWTINGRPLTPSQLEIIGSATSEDVQAVHDLLVLDAKAAGLPPPCGHDHG
jgi:hypothetical protein